MQPAYDPQSWQNFYIVAGGAAAALTGLLFVAMSLHAKTIVGNPVFGNRAVGTLMSLLTQLFLSFAVLVPGQTLFALGIEVEVAALFFLAISLRAVFRLGPRSGGSRARSRLRATAEAIGALTWIVLFVASGISLMVKAGGGFYLLAIVMLFMFGWNVYIAWILITEVAD
jgi:hypothetical protein